MSGMVFEQSNQFYQAILPPHEELNWSTCLVVCNSVFSDFKWRVNSSICLLGKNYLFLIDFGPALVDVFSEQLIGADIFQ